MPVVYNPEDYVQVMIRKDGASVLTYDERPLFKLLEHLGISKEEFREKLTEVNKKL